MTNLSKYPGIMYSDCAYFRHVHPLFRLILIAEKDTVYDKFPAPLINRLEKHIVLTSSILDDWQHDIVRELELWISLFCETRYAMGYVNIC